MSKCCPASDPYVTMYDVLMDSLANHNVDKIEMPKNVVKKSSRTSNPLVTYVVTDIGKWLVCCGQCTTGQQEDGGAEGATGAEAEAFHLQGQGEDHLQLCVLSANPYCFGKWKKIVLSCS